MNLINLFLSIIWNNNDNQQIENDLQFLKDLFPNVNFEDAIE